MSSDQDAQRQIAIDDVIDRHWWPQFNSGSTGGFLTHYCRTCQLRYTREAFKSHLRDRLLLALEPGRIAELADAFDAGYEVGVGDGDGWILDPNPNPYRRARSSK